MTYEELVAKLRARFGAAGLHERFAAELRSRRRKNGESLAELHAEIKRVMALAYPDSAHSPLGQVIAMDHFIAALDNRELELKVRDRDPCDLEAAFKAAIRVETHLKAYNADREREPVRETRNRRDRYDDNRVRQIAREPDPAPNRRVEVDDANSAKLWAQLERKQRENDELSKELGRLRLLTEQARTVAPTTPPANVEPPPERGASAQGRQFPNQPPAAARREWTDDRLCYQCGAKGHIARFCTKAASDVNKPSAGNYPRNGGQASEGKKENTQAKVVRGATTNDVCRPAYLKLSIGDAIAYALLDSGAEITVVYRCT